MTSASRRSDDLCVAGGQHLRRNVMCFKLRCVVMRSRTRIVFLEAEGRLCERVDHKNDQDDGEEDAVDIDVGER